MRLINFAFGTSAACFALRYDNLKSAVKQVLRGYRREGTSRFIAFRSHWRFQSEFCNPARGNEKGGVEGEGGYFRRDHWVPLPEARDLDELNVYLDGVAAKIRSRVLAGRSETVGVATLIEQSHCCRSPRNRSNWLRSASPRWMDCAVCACGPTDTRFRCDRGPRSKLACTPILLKLWHEGQRVARHERCYSRQQQILDLEHYLDVLKRKPGALAGSTALCAVWAAEISESAWLFSRSGLPHPW